MNFDEISSPRSESDIDPAFAALLRQQKVTYQVDDFSLESLLEAREQEVITENQSSSDEIQDVVFEAPLELPELVTPDPCVFELSQGNVPFRVLSVIDHPEPPVPVCFPRLKMWQWKALKTNPDMIEPSSTLLFSLIQELILVHSPEIGRVLIEYCENLPTASISYSDWFNCVREAMFSAPDVLPYLLALSDFNNFVFASPEEEESSVSEIILLHFSVMLCPTISEGPNYTHALKALRSNLKSASLESDSNSVPGIVLDCYSLALDVPIKNLSLIASLWPLDGIGSKVCVEVASRLCYYLLDAEVPDIIDLEHVATTLKHVGKISESMHEEDLIKASAVVALTEKIVVAGMLQKMIERPVIRKFADSLKFSFANTDVTVLTRLKEQVHITRMQIGLLLQMDGEMDEDGDIVL